MTRQEVVVMERAIPIHRFVVIVIIIVEARVKNIKATRIKQVQISARAAKNDLLVKVRQLEGFLNEGAPVFINVRLRGREKGNKDWARQKLNEFLKMIPVEYKAMSEPKFGGFGLSMQIAKK
ncbi:MAG: hypothetical protein AAB967_00780 [Patescibacteria group bacterium]